MFFMGDYKMKKYLLLATTAMLFNTSAMAGSIDPTSGHAIINASVTVAQVCSYEVTQDMDFKNVVVGPHDKEVALSMASDGTITKVADWVKRFDEDGQPGIVTYNCGSDVTIDNIKTESMSSGLPQQGADLSLHKSLTPTTSKTGEIVVYGDLTLSDFAVGEITGPAAEVYIQF